VGGGPVTAGMTIKHILPPLYNLRHPAEPRHTIAWKDAWQPGSCYERQKWSQHITVPPIGKEPHDKLAHTLSLLPGHTHSQGDGPSTSTGQRPEHTRAAIISVETDFSQVRFNGGHRGFWKREDDHTRQGRWSCCFSQSSSSFERCFIYVQPALGAQRTQSCEKKYPCRLSRQVQPALLLNSGTWAARGGANKP
jgi:hypothetical protein